MKKMETNEIKTSIIENFLKPCYQYTSLNNINILIDSIQKHSWFDTEYDKATNILSLYLGNGIKIQVKLVFVEGSQNKNGMEMYRLVDFE